VSAARSSTATGTIATAESAATGVAAGRYRGRFAPSPTGRLHHGSLVAALASWLDARRHRGAWLLRIEDLDVARNVAGSEDAILRTLDSLGLTADEPLVRQSTRADLYHAALERLHRDGLAYRCTCSRSEEPGIYSGRCRRHPAPPGPAAWRFAMTAGERIAFQDGFQGRCQFDADLLGDPVIFRRDGIAAYQLAVVVDDADQGITHVVRGADLLDSTPWQLRIGAALGAQAPAFIHVPLVTGPGGEKLAKSRSAPAVADLPPGQALAVALRLLDYSVPEEVAHSPPARILDWALQDWPPASLQGRASVALPT